MAPRRRQRYRPAMRGITVTMAALGLFACKGEPRGGFAEAARACHDADLSCPHPIFNVHDLRASQVYYRDQLGFHVDWEDGAPPTFTAVTRGHTTLFLCQGCQGTPGAWAMMFTKDIDRLHAELRERRAKIRMPPTDMPWRIREMHVSDLDGNVLRLGAPLDHDD